MKKIAILQSNYIPWKGYFDLLASVDEFILFDDAQYTRLDWRNRNRIKTPQGLQWLTVPVKGGGHLHRSIRDVEIHGTHWAGKHWKTLVQNYRQAPHFTDVAAWLEPLYCATSHTHLSALNRQFIDAICRYLGITTRITDSADLAMIDGRTERLLHLCRQAGATDYVTGPAARAYLDTALFADAGIRLHWFDYADYPQYNQPWGGFVHEVSILDLLFHCGRESHRYMRHVGA